MAFVHIDCMTQLSTQVWGDKLQKLGQHLLTGTVHAMCGAARDAAADEANSWQHWQLANKHQLCAPLCSTACISTAWHGCCIVAVQHCVHLDQYTLPCWGLRKAHRSLADCECAQQTQCLLSTHYVVDSSHKSCLWSLQRFLLLLVSTAYFSEAWSIRTTCRSVG